MSKISSKRKHYSAKMRARRKLREGLSVALSACAVLLVVWLLLHLASGSGKVASSDTFYDGIFVNGTSVGGMTFEEAKAVIEKNANDRLNAAIVLTYGERQWTITPAMLNASLTYDAQISYAWNIGHTGTNAERKAQIASLREAPMEFNSTLVYDEEKLEKFIADLKSEVDVEPVEASVIIGSGEKLTVTESKNGIYIDADELRELIRERIVEGGETTIALNAKVWEPSTSTQAAKEGTTLIASAKTSTQGSSSIRNKNIRRALKPFNGFELKDGEQLNFNKIVGKRTEENGFYPSPEYDGTSVVQGIGGGTCQASTTLYQACLRAGLTVVDRSQHTMRVHYTKPSMDAAVSDAGKNLVVLNETGHSMFFYTSVEEGYAEVKIYGTPGPYRIDLEYEITQDNIKPKGYKAKPDTSGKYVYYTTDEPVLCEKGEKGCRSRGYRIYYDPETGAEVDRQLLSQDYYYPTQPTYWVGTHTPEVE